MTHSDLLERHGHGHGHGHGLGRQLFEDVNAHLDEQGLSLQEGTIIDASIIAAPPSTNNERGPEMHQTRKGHQWYFGMKMQIGVDEVLGLAHSVEGTAANVHDLTPSAELPPSATWRRCSRR